MLEGGHLGGLDRVPLHPGGDSRGREAAGEGPLHDAARALQFVRSKAAEWNIDKERIGASGGSAGACSSLWLAFHDDMADPKSGDPVARESTRLWCAAVVGAQTTLDPQQMKEWTPNSRYGGHAFGFMGDQGHKTRDTQFDEFLAAPRRDPALDQGVFALSSSSRADDPPIYLIYTAPPALGQDQKDPTHTSNFGVKLQEKLPEPRRRVRTGLSRRARREAPDRAGLPHRETQGSAANEIIVERIMKPFLFIPALA